MMFSLIEKTKQLRLKLQNKYELCPNDNLYMGKVNNE